VLWVDWTGDGDFRDCTDGGIQNNSCTLRGALNLSNANGAGVLDEIRFNIPSNQCDAASGICTIIPGAALPAIVNNQAWIEGDFQGGCVGDSPPRIDLWGAALPRGSGSNGLELAFASDGSLVRCLILRDFPSNGIEVTSNFNRIERNYLGRHPHGGAGNSHQGLFINGRFGGGISNVIQENTVVGNGQDGVLLWASHDNTVSFNVISANVGNGIGIGNGASYNVIAGNHVGVNAAGTASLGNGRHGVYLGSGAVANSIGTPAGRPQNIISANASNGVMLDGVSGNEVIGNYIGLDQSGTTNVPGSDWLANREDGVLLWGAADNTISSNVISGNALEGVAMGNGASGNLVEDNIIGLDAAGNAMVGNGRYGVYVLSGATNNWVGSIAEPSNSVISGNGSHGVLLEGVFGNYVEGNHIGTDQAGTVDLGNFGHGLAVSGGGNNRVNHNVISGNNLHGVVLVGTTGGNSLQGNYIGANAAGSGPLGNTGWGIAIHGAGANTIGGSVPNLISSNTADGINIAVSGGGNQISENYIGTDIDGTGALGNGEAGIEISDVPSNTVGGTGEGEGNTIAHNAADGVRVEGNTATGNAIRGNSMYSNGGKGIENLDGGNTELAPPVIMDPSNKTGTACANCQIDIFADDGDEGGFYHGSTTAGSAGDWTFPGGVIGPNMTATATDAAGNTSEFSLPASVPATAEFGGPEANPESPSGTDDPVNLATGNYSYDQIDVEIEGKGLPLLFMRTYNSQDTISGRLGFGWHDNLRARLLFSGTDHSIADVTVVTETGRQDFYERQQDASYKAPSGIFDTLTRNPTTGSFTVRRKDRSKLNFDSAGQLISMEDGNGNQTTLTYSPNLTTLTDPSGRTLTFAYDASDRISSVTDPVSRTTTYTYNASSDLSSVTSPDGETETYTYDANHRLLTITDPNGNVIAISYDAAGRAAQVTEGARTTTINYESRRSVQNDGIGCSTIHEYDERFRETRVTDCTTGGVTAYTYDSAGNETSETDPLGRTVTFSYDARGNLTSYTDTDGKVSTYAYNTQDDVLSTTDELGRTTTNTYDANGNLLTTTEPGDVVSSYSYDASGQLTSERDPLGQTTTYAYDANGNITQVTDPLGNTSRSTYDAAGRVHSRTDPLGNVTTYAYDANDRPLSVTDPLGHTTFHTYDANGNKASETDPNGKVTAYSYDSSNRLTSVTDPASGVTSYTYDAVGNITSVTDANGHTSSSTYDSLRRLISKTDALSNTTTYAYDSAGNRIRRTDANGVTTTYAYDRINRLVSRSYSNGEPTVTFTYDAAGNRTQMTDGTGTTAYVYDSLNRLTQVTFPGPKTVGYQYDADGKRTRLTYPDGKQVTYAYDTANRLVTVTDWAARTTSYTYDATGRLTTISRPNGVTSTHGYDAASRLTSIAQPGGNISYTLDNAGNRLTRTQGSDAETYTYDDLYRLTGVQYVQGDCQAYTYDAVGNRLSLTTRAKVSGPCDGAPNTTTYTFDDADRLVSESGRPYYFDKNGNQTGRGNDRYTYDAENRVVAIGEQPPATPPSVGSACVDANDDGFANALDLSIMGKNYGATSGQPAFNFQIDLNWDGAVNDADQNREGSRFLQSCQDFRATYVYDGDGRRVSKRENGTTTSYVWDVAADLPVILQDSGGSTYQYGQALVMQEVSGTPRWYLQDGLGSTTGLTQADGLITDAYSYDAFGSVRSRFGTTLNEFTFAGQQLDTSELQFLRARYYDPKAGRFLSSDPRKASTHEPYSYAGNDPISNKDPSGLDWRYDASDWLAGFGDRITFGGTRQARRWINYHLNGDRSDVVDSKSVFYRWGGHGGSAAELVPVGGGAAKGIVRAKKALAARGSEGVKWTAGSRQYKLHYDQKPHNFRGVGKQPHFQLTWHKPGKKGSHKAIRVPWR
jgi:RHS repeat-associated protein